MTDWKDYATTSRKTSQGGGDVPKVSDYVIIKFVDNWVSVCVFILVLICAGMGLLCATSDKASVIESGKWFFESSKICLGVFLGLIAQKK